MWNATSTETTADSVGGFRVSSLIPALSGSPMMYSMNRCDVVSAWSTARDMVCPRVKSVSSSHLSELIQLSLLRQKRRDWYTK